MAADGTSLPEPPAQLKAIQAYMKIASDIERVNPILAYWVRLYCCETALKIDRDSPESKSFLGSLIVWLENFKSSNKGNEGISDQTKGFNVAKDFVVTLFNKADTIDREGNTNKTTVRMFYMAAMLFDTMNVFGPLDQELAEKAKYAKFKAAYIQKCLKLGQVPKPGPVDGADLEMPSEGVPGQQPNQPPLPDDPNRSITSPPSMDTPTIPHTPTSGYGQPGAGSEPHTTTPSSSSIPGFPSASIPPKPIDIVPSRLAKAEPPAPPANTPVMPSSLIGGPGVSSTISATKFQALNGSPLNPEDLMKSQKYCKWANSALQYDDIPTAVANLEKALNLLRTGEQPRD